MKRPRAILVLNPRARGGTGAARYLEVRQVVESRCQARRVELDDRGAWRHAVADGLADGVRLFLAAGGDGTVGALAGAIVERRGSVALDQITLGAIGLGSSNDFHKPVRTAVAGIPLRIDGPGIERDLARARYLDGSGVERERIFVVSASLGATAAANERFNGGDRALVLLKRTWVELAILYAAVRTIAAHRSIRARIRVGGRAEEEIELDNLSVLKTPYLSGGLRYDTPVEPASGLLAVNLCERMGRARLLSTLAGLARGRFAGRPGTRHFSADSVALAFPAVVPLELDGEVVRASRVIFDLLPERIRACA
jgi:diacylglycerol kinase family enzyme